MHGEDVEHHEADADERGVNGGAVGMGFLAHFSDDEFGVIVGVFDVINDGHGADKNLACSEGADESDADFPIEAKRLDCGFDGFPESSGDAVGEGIGFRRVFGCFWVSGGGPDEDRQGEDDGACALEEHLGAVEHSEEHVTDCGDAVGGHFEQQHGRFAAEKGALEDPSERKGDADAQSVHGENDCAFLPSRGFGEEERNHERINRKPR